MGAVDLISGALRLDPTAFEALALRPDGLRFSLLVVLLAGLSSGIGQSVVLFANGVKPRRFIASLLLSALIFVVGFLFWTSSITLVARTLFERDAPTVAAVRAVGLAYAPQLLGFFVLTPYFGSAFGVGLSVWNLLAILVATQVVFDLTLGQALVAGALGWLLLQLAQRTIGRPVLRLSRWLQRSVAGTPLDRRGAVTKPEQPEDPDAAR